MGNKMFILFYFKKNVKNTEIYFAVTKVMYIFTEENIKKTYRNSSEAVCIKKCHNGKQGDIK